MSEKPDDEVAQFIKTHYAPPSSRPEPAKLNLVVGGPVPSLQNSSPVEGEVSTPGLNLDPTFKALILDATFNKSNEVVLVLSGDNRQIRERIRGNLINAERQISMSKDDAQKLVAWFKQVGATQTRGTITWTTWMREIRVRSDLFHVHVLLTDVQHSQHVSLRLSQKKEKFFSPSSWGMDPAQARTFSEFLERNHGLILFGGTASEGIDDIFIASGNMMATPTRHVIAVEDAPQTWVAGVDSFLSDSHPEQFHELLRLAFQHTPDVLLVNPLNAKEDIDLCLREAVKGHFVMARAFASDACEMLLQFLSQGIEPYLIGSGIVGVVAKKTLRLNCGHCQIKDSGARVLARELGIPLAMQPASFYKGKGCAHCGNSGFDGETDIFEVFPIDDDVRLNIRADAKNDVLRAALKSKGLLTFRQIAIHKAINGQVSLSEVTRHTSK